MSSEERGNEYIQYEHWILGKNIKIYRTMKIFESWCASCGQGKAYRTKQQLQNGKGCRKCRNNHRGQTHCSNGHAFTPENTYRHGTRRDCKTCREESRLRNHPPERRYKGAKNENT